MSSICRILSLDGGGAKGFYTLGVLKEIEGMLGYPLCQRFDLVFGTSTGAIIAALIALGRTVEEIHTLYKEYVPSVMKARTAKDKSRVLAGSVAQAHGRAGTFVPGFGCTISDAVQASCSAYPFFDRKAVTTSDGDTIELIDGGYCANNPTLYAIADAVVALDIPRKDIRVVSVGVGVYPQPKPSFKMWFLNQLKSVQLLQKTLEINTQSMEQLRSILFSDVPTVRINETFERPEMATDLLEHDLEKLNILRQRGRESFAGLEPQLSKYLE